MITVLGRKFRVDIERGNGLEYWILHTKDLYGAWQRRTEESLIHQVCMMPPQFWGGWFQTSMCQPTIWLPGTECLKFSHKNRPSFMEMNELSLCSKKITIQNGSAMVRYIKSPSKKVCLLKYKWCSVKCLNSFMFCNMKNVYGTPNKEFIRCNISNLIMYFNARCNYGQHWTTSWNSTSSLPSAKRFLLQEIILGNEISFQQLS